MDRFEREADSKDELLALMDEAWPLLLAMFDDHEEAALTTRTDAAGWSAKDHLAHITTWERGMLAYAASEPRGEAMGVPEDIWEEGDVDRVNDTIFQAVREKPLADVRREADETHAQLRETIAGMTDDDLHVPDAVYAGGDGDFPAIGRFCGNTYWHYAEHIPWIEEILGDDA